MDQHTNRSNMPLLLTFLLLFKPHFWSDLIIINYYTYSEDAVICTFHKTAKIHQNYSDTAVVTVYSDDSLIQAPIVRKSP